MNETVTNSINERRIWAKVIFWTAAVLMLSGLLFGAMAVLNPDNYIANRLLPIALVSIPLVAINAMISRCPFCYRSTDLGKMECVKCGRKFFSSDTDSIDGLSWLSANFTKLFALYIFLAALIASLFTKSAGMTFGLIGLASLAVIFYVSGVISDPVVKEMTQRRRFFYIGGSIFLIIYGGFGVAFNDLCLPGRFGGRVHFHGIAAWIAYGALLSLSGAALVNVWANDGDNGPKQRYLSIARNSFYLSWALIFLALFIHTLMQG